MAKDLIVFHDGPLSLSAQQCQGGPVDKGCSVIETDDGRGAERITYEKEYISSEISQALDTISKLMLHVIEEKTLDVKFSNPHLVKCYEELNCSKSKCQCYGKDAVRCWLQTGTFCGGEVQGAFAQKIGNCSECAVFRKATADPVYKIGEYFNNMMHIIEIKNNELKDAYNELKATHATILQQEKMATIGQLAAGIAHEINNPTGFITSNIGTMGKYFQKMIEFINIQREFLMTVKEKDVLDAVQSAQKRLKIDYLLDDVKDLIGESLDGTERIRKIVHNLKSFARVNEAEYKDADINECIESTLNIVWNELKYKTTVRKEYGELPLIKCYPHELNQVVMNLLVNAAQAIEKQGEIVIRTWNGNGAVYMSISDTGCGMTEDTMKRIFDPFFTTKEIGKGTGLGLSITFDIVKKHNGEIHVDSEIGRGTSFTIKIPVINE